MEYFHLLLRKHLAMQVYWGLTHRKVPFQLVRLLCLKLYFYHCLDYIRPAWSFFWQVPGAMVPWVLVIILVNSSLSTNMVWRFILAAGSIPAALVVVFVCIEISQETTSKKQILHSNNFQKGEFRCLLSANPILC